MRRQRFRVVRELVTNPFGDRSNLINSHLEVRRDEMCVDEGNRRFQPGLNHSHERTQVSRFMEDSPDTNGPRFPIYMNLRLSGTLWRWLSKHTFRGA